MELRNIKTFIKIAEIGNFSKAAVELGYAQSTVTTQMQTLEEELQVTLFDRNGKRVTLSDAGKEFLEYAYQIQRSEAMALEHFSKDNEPAGDITVGVMETMCASRFGEIFREYGKRYPKVNMKVEVATTLQCMEMLSKGTVDVILTVDKKLHNSSWETAHELPTEICFFCAADHPFANKKNVPVDDLICENFIQIEEGCNYRQAFEQYLDQRGQSIRNVMEIGYTRLIIDAVSANLGVSLLPRFTLTDALRAGSIATFTVRDYSIDMLMQVVYSKNRWLTPALRAFLNLSRELFPQPTVK